MKKKSPKSAATQKPIGAYDHAKIEAKWQKQWDKKKAFQAHDPKSGATQAKKKFYGLIEFPYPSGDGLHVGHIRSNTAMDIIARKRRREGFEVLYPIGWDAFGLPTENYAIKTGIQPAIVTKKNTDIFRRQLKALGFSFDWSREINTTDPAYYRWTQWIFLQFLKKGLAYKKKMTINWCPKDLIGLANEEVVNGCCERCGTPVEKRDKEQWMLAITKYAERLDKDLDSVDFLERIKIQQRNWIGKSEGAEIEFEISILKKSVTVFTTRPDTLFGVTYVVLAPEHSLVTELLSSVENRTEVEQYISKVKKETDIERTDAKKEKTGVQLEGIKAVNPANKEEIPVWIADYVLADYGTGAVMAVPAHDERDFEFANKYGLPVKKVIVPDLNTTDFWFFVYGGMSRAKGQNESFDQAETRHKQEAISRIKEGVMIWTGHGLMTNSSSFDGRDSTSIKKEITDFAGGRWITTFKLRDWVFSRQRYWGEPIPVVHCDKCGIVPIPEKDLPVKLPKVKNYKPTETGESPLAAISKWVNTKCPTCKGKATRETDTMPNWAGSSWYYLRYVDPKNKKAFADRKKLDYWVGDQKQAGGVDWYNGGMEHTTLHLLYSRFWHKFLYDLGLVPISEPYHKRTSHGLILAAGGEKMSKSKGNVVNPDSIVATVGADSLRLYEMFMGPFDQPIAWNTDNIAGVRRFIERVWKLKEKVAYDETKTNNAKIIHKTIKKVSDDIEAMRFNTAISTLMIALNELEKSTSIEQKDYETILQLLAPFAPHITEELWASLGHTDSIHASPWPVYDSTLASDSEVTIMIQINGKTRGSFTTQTDTSKEDIEKLAKENPDAKKWLEGKSISKVIVVPNKLVNIVVA